jgi:hypothetical protein
MQAEASKTAGKSAVSVPSAAEMAKTQITAAKAQFPPTATPHARKAIQSAGGVTPFYCELCNIGE